MTMKTTKPNMKKPPAWMLILFFCAVCMLSYGQSTLQPSTTGQLSGGSTTAINGFTNTGNGLLATGALGSAANLLYPPAQGTGNKWRFLLEPYFMFPNIDGTITVGENPPTEINQNPGDVFSHIQFAGSLYMEAYNGSMTLSSDLTYMNLGSDVYSTGVVSSGHVTVQQWAWELAFMFKFAPWLDAGLAGQFNSIENTANLVVLSNGGTSAEYYSRTHSWVDPSIVARAKLPLGQSHWFLQLRGNVGGFDVASKFYWQAQGYFSYMPTRAYDFSFGYRAIGIDYETGSGTGFYKYDTTTFGPVFRFGFYF